MYSPFKQNEFMEKFFIDEETFAKMTFRDLEVFKIYHKGNYERENLVLIANTDINCLYDYILVALVEREDGLPDYEKCRFLTFDDQQLQKGDRICIPTCKGEDYEEIGPKTGKHYHVVYWNLDASIWNHPRISIEIMKRGDSYSVGYEEK